MDVKIRWLINVDFPAVLAIENEGFGMPWVKDEFMHVLRRKNCIGMVAEHDERVVGFMVYGLERTRLDLLNFAVAARYRNQGVGRQMLDKIKNKLSADRRTRIIANIAERNIDAQLFFRACGFRAVKVIRDEYCDGQDAYQFRFRLPVEQPVAEQIRICE